MNKAIRTVNDHLNVQDANIERVLKGSDHLWRLLTNQLTKSPIYMIIKEVGHIEAYKLFPEKYLQEWYDNFELSQPISQFQSICREWLMFRGCVNCFNGINRFVPVEQSKNMTDSQVSFGHGDGWICISCGKFHLNYS